MAFHQYRFSALDVEDALMSLAYVSEACVLSVPHQGASELCGAVVGVYRGIVGADEVTLPRLRADLDGRLAPYMLPTVLRVLDAGEDLPRTASGKPIKARVLRECLGVRDWFVTDDVPQGVQYWGSDAVPDMAEADMKPWDMGGLQEAE